MDIEKLKDRLLEWDGVETVDNGEFIEVNYHVCNAHVTHWMLLPKPPKEEKK